MKENIYVKTVAGTLLQIHDFVLNYLDVFGISMQKVKDYENGQVFELFYQGKKLNLWVVNAFSYYFEENNENILHVNNLCDAIVKAIFNKKDKVSVYFYLNGTYPYEKLLFGDGSEYCLSVSKNDSGALAIKLRCGKELLFENSINEAETTMAYFERIKSEIAKLNIDASKLPFILAMLGDSRLVEAFDMLVNPSTKTFIDRNRERSRINEIDERELEDSKFQI